MNRLALTALALSFAAATAGCMSPPSNLDLSLTRPTLEQHYLVTLQPPAGTVPLHQLHRWQVKLATPAGVPVAHARIQVDGGMPQHGHGLPTRPQVTQELPDGTYVIDGMKFSMTGWWEIKLAIQGAEGADRVTFNTVVATSAPAAASERWSGDELAVLASLSLKRLPPAPADPSNAVEALLAAVELGRRLFTDMRFSANGAVSCASCHDPRRQFQDGRSVGQGVGTGTRRSMPVVGAGRGPWLFWDGRKDSLWAQALGPLEDAVEHGGNRTRDARLLATHYGAEYEAVFGRLPKLEGLPADAGPKGTAAEKAAWAAMSARQRSEVSRVFANLGKAIAAYEKTLAPEPSRLDRYLDAVVAGRAAGPARLRDEELRGLRLFIGKGQCVGCHNGPLFTDHQFHNTGVPPRDATQPDRGRADATALLRGDEFNCLGPFSDAPPDRCQELRFMVDDAAELLGAFKTPSLRGVAQRPPYMHAGQVATLEQVLRHYIAAPHAAVGHSELTHRHAGQPAAGHGERAPIELDDAEIADLVAFLGTLGGEAAAVATAAAP